MNVFPKINKKTAGLVNKRLEVIKIQLKKINDEIECESFLVEEINDAADAIEDAIVEINRRVG